MVLEKQRSKKYFGRDPTLIKIIVSIAKVKKYCSTITVIQCHAINPLYNDVIQSTLSLFL